MNVSCCSELWWNLREISNQDRSNEAIYYAMTEICLFTEANVKNVVWSCKRHNSRSGNWFGEQRQFFPVGWLRCFFGRRRSQPNAVTGRHCLQRRPTADEWTGLAGPTGDTFNSYVFLFSHNHRWNLFYCLNNTEHNALNTWDRLHLHRYCR